MRRWCFWKQLSTLRGQIPRILSYCHCMGGEEKKNDWWFPGAIQRYSALPEIGRTRDSDMVNIWNVLLIPVLWKESRRNASIWIARTYHCQFLQSGLSSNVLPQNSELVEPKQTFIYSANIYWLPPLCQLPRIYWQARQTEPLPSRMLSIRRQENEKESCYKLIKGSTDLERRVEIRTLIHHPSHFLFPAPSTHSSPNDGMPEWMLSCQEETGCSISLVSPLNEEPRGIVHHNLQFPQETGWVEGLCLAAANQEMVKSWFNSSLASELNHILQSPLWN